LICQADNTACPNMQSYCILVDIDAKVKILYRSPVILLSREITYELTMVDSLATFSPASLISIVLFVVDLSKRDAGLHFFVVDLVQTRVPPTIALLKFRLHLVLMRLWVSVQSRKKITHNPHSPSSPTKKSCSIKWRMGIVGGTLFYWFKCDAGLHWNSHKSGDCDIIHFSR